MMSLTNQTCDCGWGGYCEWCHPEMFMPPARPQAAVPSLDTSHPGAPDPTWIDCPNCKSPMRADRDECRNCGHDQRGLCRMCGQTHCTCDDLTVAVRNWEDYGARRRARGVA